jgi:hypothetical protein
MTVTEMRNEPDAQCGKNRVRRRVLPETNIKSLSTAEAEDKRETDLQSVASADDDDEFFDCSDEINT